MRNLSAQFECPSTSGELGECIVQRCAATDLQLRTSEDADPKLGQRANEPTISEATPVSQCQIMSQIAQVAQVAQVALPIGAATWCLPYPTTVNLTQ